MCRLLYPNRCAYCGALLEPDQLRCAACERELEGIGTDICVFCGKRREDCDCKKHKNEYCAIAAPFYYAGLPKSAVARVKFSDRLTGIQEMAFQMETVISTFYTSVAFDAVSFVPATKKKDAERGCNLAGALAALIAQEMKIELFDCLEKLYENEEQHKLNFKERKGNVSGVFQVKENMDVSDKTILLIDDVKTTGSTLNECAKMLNIFGAKAVWACTFALTGGKKDVKRE